VGSGSNLLFRGDITDLAPKISLPYMVGPGTIWVSILIGSEYNLLFSLGIIASVLLVNFVFLALYQLVQYRLSGRRETMIAKYFAILMRTNALFIGAIAVEMIVKGTESLARDYVQSLLR